MIIGYFKLSKSLTVRWLVAARVAELVRHPLQPDPVQVLLELHGHAITTIAELEVQAHLQNGLVLLHGLRDGHLHLVAQELRLLVAGLDLLQDLLDVGGLEDLDEGGAGDGVGLDVELLQGAVVLQGDGQGAGGRVADAAVGHGQVQEGAVVAQGVEDLQ